MNQKKCLWCKNKILNKNSKKFCCRKHMCDYKYCEKFLEWYINNNISVDSQTLKKHIETISGYKCKRCGIHQWNNKYICLQLEHIDGNSKNNKEDNICLLCPNCHSLTQTYKSKNKGNGRYLLKCKYETE